MSKDVRKFIIFYGEKPFILPKFERYGGYKRFEYQKLSDAKQKIKDIIDGKLKRNWWYRECEQQKEHDKFWESFDYSKLKIAEHGIVRVYTLDDCEANK